MKAQLENYNVLFALMAVCAVSVLLKAVSYGLFHKLLWDSNQMGTTGNRWMKAMMSKFEAYYKLHISVHNVENFVDRYLYHYRFIGISLQTWENLGFYFSGLIAAGAGVFCFLAGYYGMPSEWFWVTGLVTLLLLCVQGASEVFFDTHKCLRVFRIQLIDYMENTMRARLENEYFHQEAVTTPIGVALADMLGGVTSITAIAIVITGIFGAILLPTFLKCIGVRNPMQMGLSIGTAAHAVGTSRAIQLGETEGAISGLAIGVAGLLTAFIVSALSVFM